MAIDRLDIIMGVQLDITTMILFMYEDTGHE